MALLRHKRALGDYEILERFEAGIELLGTEVKSMRGGQGKLDGAHIITRGGEVFVVGMQIPSYQPANAPRDFDPSRTRRLLLTHREIATLSGWEAKKGYTILPLSAYAKGRKIKLEIAVARGKKKYDKREDLKKREDARAMQRAFKNYGKDN